MKQMLQPLHHCRQYHSCVTARAKRSQTTTTATTLSPRAVGWRGRDVLDTADLHAGTGEGAESGLGAWAWGLGAVACHLISLYSHSFP